MQEHQLKADDIAKVETGLSPMTYVHCAWEYKAQGVTAAQMNLFYGMAVIAIDGEAFTRQYHESRLREPGILAFVAKQTAYVDKEIEAMGKDFRHACRVRVTTKGGQALEKLALHRRGSPEKPLAPSEIVDKFYAVVSPCMAREDAKRIVELVGRIETLDSLQPLIAAVAKPVELKQ
jgi:2-methylcitrate dehydratase PrpD